VPTQNCARRRISLACERLVFEPDTREVFDETVKWIGEHGIFDAGTAACSYDRAVTQA